MKIQFAF